MHPTGPSLTLLISTYNDRRHVAKKLAEIQGQTAFRDVEVIFIETGSPQAERELLTPFCQRHANCRLLTTDDRRSLYQAWNMGWAEARGEWVCYSNMDDAMHPRLLETVRASIARHRWDLCSVLIAKQQESDPRLDSWDPRRIRGLSLSTRPGPFTAWRRDLLETFGPFDEALVTTADKEFWARALARGLRYGVIPRILYQYTRGAGQLSKQGIARADAGHLASRPYPVIWPARYRNLARLGNLLLKIAPGALVVDPP